MHLLNEYIPDKFFFIKSMLNFFYKSIYQYPKSKRYCDVIEVLSEIQIQFSLFHIMLIERSEMNYLLLSTTIQPGSLLINLRSPPLYDLLMNNFIVCWIINISLCIYLIIPLFILLPFINIKYVIVPKIAYSWISYFGYIHVYIISFIIHGWLTYQIKESISHNLINLVWLEFSLVLIIINIVISIFICKACISQVYVSGFISYKYKYYKWMNLGFKLTFPIFQVFEPSSIKNIILLVFLMTWCILRQISLIFANPFYGYNTTKIMSCIQGITFGIIISNSIAILIKTKGGINIEHASNICGILLFFISSLFSRFFMLISIKNMKEILNKKEKLSDIDYVSQYFLIDQYINNCHKTTFNEQDINLNELIGNGLYSSHRMECIKCQDEESLQSIRNHILETKISEGLKTHKDSFIINCLALNFFLQRKDYFYRSCFLLEKIKKATLSIENKMVLKVYEVNIEEILCNANNHKYLDYGRFAAYENFFQEFLCLTENATKTYLKFWSEINSSRPNLLDIIKSSLQIYKDHQKFKKKLKVYETKFIDDFGKPWLLAGLYYEILKHKHDKSFFMLQKYRKFRAQLTSKKFSDQITEDSFYSKDNVNIRISGADDFLGNIISCSDNISEIININAGKLIGRNINKILPNFFSANHNNFIRNFKETGISNIINHTSHQFCKHESGHLVPVKINVSIYPFLDCGLTFLGIMKIIKGSFEYILANQNGQIEGMTLDISKDLNFRPNDKINFCSLLKLNGDNHIEELNNEIYSPTTCNLQSVATTQIGQSGFNDLINKKTSKGTYNKNFSQFLSNISHQSTVQFQNFVDEFSKTYIRNGKKVILTKILTSNNSKTMGGNMHCRYLEYIVSLEKNCYKFGLQLYSLKLTKSNSINNNFTFKLPKIQLKSINYEDNSSIQEYPGNSNGLLSILPMEKKPKFIQEIVDDTNSKICLDKQKNVIALIKSKDQILPKTLNLIIPKTTNLIELDLNFQGDNLLENKSIRSDNQNYIDRNVDDSYSIKRIYFNKNTKIKSQTRYQEENFSRKFFTFRSIFLEININLMILLFLISITGIFIIYGTSIVNIPKINRNLIISYHSNQRLADLVQINRRSRLIWLIQANLMSDDRHQWRNVSSYYQNSIDRGNEASAFLLSNNSLMLQEIQYIDEKYQNAFYSQLVDLYSVDKSNQKTLNHTDTDSFISGYQIYQVFKKISKVKIQQMTLNNSDLLFILVNTLNDIYIEFERSTYILNDEITSLLDDIKQNSELIFYGVSTMSIISILVLIPGLSALFYKKKSILMQIINMNMHFCQSQIHRLNKFCKGLKENYSDGEFIAIYNPNQGSQNGIQFKKSNDQNNGNIYAKHDIIADTFGIKLGILKFFWIFLIISSIHIFIFFSEVVIGGIYVENIKTAIQRLLYSSKMLTEQNFAMTTVYEFIGENGTTIVKNKPVEYAINETMPIIGYLEGFLANFRNKKGELDQNLKNIMVGNVCTIIPPEYVNECVLIGGGPGQNGLSSLNSYIFTALNIGLTTFNNSNRTIQDANNTFSLWYLKNLEGMFYRVVTSAYGCLYNQLLTDLNNDFKSYKTFSLVWTLISFFFLLFIAIIICLPMYRKLINEIMSMKRITKILPKSIRNNKFYQQ